MWEIEMMDKIVGGSEGAHVVDVDRTQYEVAEPHTQDELVVDVETRDITIRPAGHKRDRTYADTPKRMILCCVNVG